MTKCYANTTPDMNIMIYMCTWLITTSIELKTFQKFVYAPKQCCQLIVASTFTSYTDKYTDGGTWKNKAQRWNVLV